MAAARGFGPRSDPLDMTAAAPLLAEVREVRSVAVEAVLLLGDNATVSEAAVACLRPKDDPDLKLGRRRLRLARRRSASPGTDEVIVCGGCQASVVRRTSR
jgi:hypothetical protein